MSHRTRVTWYVNRVRVLYLRSLYPLPLKSPLPLTVLYPSEPSTMTSNYDIASDWCPYYWCHYYWCHYYKYEFTKPTSYFDITFAIPPHTPYPAYPRTFVLRHTRTLVPRQTLVPSYPGIPLYPRSQAYPRTPLTPAYSCTLTCVFFFLIFFFIFIFSFSNTCFFSCFACST